MNTDNDSMATHKTNDLWAVFSVIAVICAVYWQSLLLPFIQDDWLLLRHFQTNGSLSVLQGFFKYENKLFYRPLANGYLLLMYKLFGPNPVPFHTVALIVHTINSYLIALILHFITGNRLISYLTALIYAAAIAIHLDPLAWAVGIFDVGGAFFFFFSMWLFLSHKPVASATVYFLGCLCKESLILLPFILFSYPLLMNTANTLKETVRSHWKQTVPFLVPIGIIATIKLSGAFPLDFPDTHPYVMNMTGIHILENIQMYSTWMFQSFFPFPSVKQYPFQLIIFGVVLVLLYGILATFRLSEQACKHRHIFFLLLWLFIGLLPILFLPNHTYRYYSTYSLPAFIGSVLVLIRMLFLSFNVKDKTIRIILITISSIAVTSSIVQGNQIYRKGLDHITLSDGTNRLIRKAAFVDIVRKGLKQHLPNAPDNTVILIGGANIWSFYKDSGPQFWYNKGSIRIYSTSNLKSENGQLYIDNPIESLAQAHAGSGNRKVVLDPARLFFCQILNGKLINPRLSDIIWETY